jgi:integrase
MELYNADIKELFLNMYENEDSKSTYKRIFIKSADTERVLGKDLAEFSKSEIEDFLSDLAPLTSAISRSNGRIVTSYISWCIDAGYKKVVMNPLKLVDSEWFDKFVDKSVKLYFTEKEITEIERFCENAQDAVIIRLYFEGVAGKDSCEIRNLNKFDVDFKNNILHLRNEKGMLARSIEVSDRTIKLIEEALSEKTYTKRNGQMEVTENIKEFTTLVENDYVLRNSVTKTDNYSGAVQSSVVYRRLKVISETLGIPYFTGKNILRSGILHRAKGMFHNRKFDYEKFRPLAERFNIKNIYSVKDYCNIETIESLYEEDEYCDECRT